MVFRGAIVKMHAIEVNQLHKQFKLVRNRSHSLKALLTSVQRPKREIIHVLKDISFTVEAGETLAIIGRNGSGKSTLLGLLARIYKPDGGSVKVNGRLAPLLELGAGFHPDLTGIENIYLNGSILGLKNTEIDKRLDSIISFAALEQFIESPIRTYSSGMVARLGFSVAIHTDPDILLVDEVLGVGDAAFQEKCEKKIRQLQANGTTIIFVSHSLRSVREVSTRALWLDSGHVRMDGGVDEVLSEYLASQDMTMADVH